jgi:hypothetical protein
MPHLHEIKQKAAFQKWHGEGSMMWTTKAEMVGESSET